MWREVERRTGRIGASSPVRGHHLMREIEGDVTGGGRVSLCSSCRIIG
jgi:hypothetical protein